MSLNNRVATVLTTVVPSTDAETLLREVAVAINAAEKNLSEQRARALDPTSIDKVVSAARKAIGELEFDVERLREAEKRLQARFDDLAAAEAAARAKAERDDLLARQTAIRVKFAAEYPDMAKRIASLAEEMVAAGLETELPKIHLGDGAAVQVGSGFNHRRYWPRPQAAYEQPAPSQDSDSGEVIALRTANPSAA